MMKEFADKVVAPGTVERDRTKQFIKEIFKQLGEMGIMGLLLTKLKMKQVQIQLVLQS